MNTFTKILSVSAMLVAVLMFSTPAALAYGRSYQPQTQYAVPRQSYQQPAYQSYQQPNYYQPYQQPNYYQPVVTTYPGYGYGNGGNQAGALIQDHINFVSSFHWFPSYIYYSPYWY